MDLVVGMVQHGHYFDTNGHCLYDGSTCLVWRAARRIRSFVWSMDMSLTTCER